jgi:hypothetical protein
LQRKL